MTEVRQSFVVEVLPMSTTDRKPPVKPRRLSTRIEEQDDTLILNMRDAHWGSGIFLLLWLIAWTVGCVALVWVVIAQRQPFMVLFAIPFWLSWIFVAARITNSFCGRHRFILDPEGLFHEWHALIPLTRRQVPLPEIRRFRVRQ